MARGGPGSLARHGGVGRRAVRRRHWPQRRLGDGCCNRSPLVSSVKASKTGVGDIPFFRQRGAVTLKVVEDLGHIGVGEADGILDASPGRAKTGFARSKQKRTGAVPGQVPGQLL